MVRSLFALAAGVALVGTLGAADAPKEKAKERGPSQTVADTVRTLIEMSDQDPGSTEELQAIYDLLRKLDTNKNGKLDPQALKAEADKILQHRVREVFTRLDTNQDGKISREEARGRIKEDFDKIDTNKDGFIEFEELMKAARARIEAKAPEAPKPLEKEKK